MSFRGPWNQVSLGGGLKVVAMILDMSIDRGVGH